MLPWLFAVLLALNLAMFWWGRQHEVPIEPQLPPLADAPQQIRLLARSDAVPNAPGIPPVQNANVPDPDAPPPATPATANPVAADAATGTEPPAPAVEALTEPGDVTPPEFSVTSRPEQAVPLPENEANAPDEGAPPDPPRVIEQADQPALEPHRLYVPNADAPPGPTPADGTGFEVTAPAAAAAATAAAPKPTKKRKPRKRAPTPPPVDAVELPLEFE
jgi:hypothetical protein